MSKVKKGHPLLRYCEGETRRPFSNGTEFEIWDGNNCTECASCNPIRFDDNSKAERLAKKGKHCHMECHLSEMASDNKALASELRKYPFTVEEAFRPSVGSAIIDPLICGNAMAEPTPI